MRENGNKCSLSGWVLNYDTDLDVNGGKVWMVARLVMYIFTQFVQVLMVDCLVMYIFTVSLFRF